MDLLIHNCDGQSDIERYIKSLKMRIEELETMRSKLIDYLKNTPVLIKSKHFIPPRKGQISAGYYVFLNNTVKQELLDIVKN